MAETLNQSFKQHNEYLAYGKNAPLSTEFKHDFKEMLVQAEIPWKECQCKEDLLSDFHKFHEIGSCREKWQTHLSDAQKGSFGKSLYNIASRESDYREVVVNSHVADPGFGWDKLHDEKLGLFRKVKDNEITPLKPKHRAKERGGLEL
jgi:hypothetical protein